MLDSETKRRIDTARDILVGKVPDPKSQVEQITIALIYKFMDDMDAISEELGGERKFFTGDFARYGWAKLMRSGLGGHETLGLYAEAITRMPENPGIPLLFRDIFKNAFLPYRDPETLRAFLKVIDEFTYDHSERLGDAFEYLLSVLGSQGDAGQFRTPRHIIDFIVAVVAPKKNETILDPACGTAGFLISAWKHIVKANTEANGVCTLTPDERTRLAQGIRGYDISPDMVRLSLVNLYLHDFTDPHIVEYDSLTSMERWGETADVILANPPFMSPKGGIKPHNRFSVQSKRSEVLFVDYMAEHLNTDGRAGIIVPEGIIFQSQSAYKDLRKMLVNEYLVAVVSLPAGVFNPYSGVKTSILILDKALARQSSTIGFFKVENDGFGLGAQRRPIEKNDLQQVQTEIGAYLEALRNHRPADELELNYGLVVPKEKVVENGEFNLSGERYRDSVARDHKFLLMRIGNVCSTSSGGTPLSGTAAFYEQGTIPWIRSGEVAQGEIFHSEQFITYEGLRNSSAKIFPRDTVLVAMYGATAGEVGILRFEAATNQAVCGIIPDDRLLPDFLYLILKSNKPLLIRLAGGGAQPNISQKIIREIEVPVPPLDVQKEIVAEIEGYQKVIDGARAVLDNYRPHIPIHPDWPELSFDKAPFEIIDGDRGVNYPSKEDFSAMGHCLFLNTKNVRIDGFKFEELEFISEEKDAALRKGKLNRGDVVLTTRGTVGNTAIYDEAVPYNNVRINSGMLIFRPVATELSSSYLFHFFQSANFRAQVEAIVSGSAQPQLPIRSLKEARIVIPSIEMQQDIVAEIEQEGKLVSANRELIARFEKKIQAALARVWGEEQQAAAEA